MFYQYPVLEVPRLESPRPQNLNAANLVLEKTVSTPARYEQIALHVREVTRWRW
jgi:hypothetical protein